MIISFASDNIKHFITKITRVQKWLKGRCHFQNDGARSLSFTLRGAEAIFTLVDLSPGQILFYFRDDSSFPERLDSDAPRRAVRSLPLFFLLICIDHCASQSSRLVYWFGQVPVPVKMNNLIRVRYNNLGNSHFHTSCNSTRIKWERVGFHGEGELDGAEKRRRQWWWKKGERYFWHLVSGWMITLGEISNKLWG